jgi:hypothetical protein
MSCEIQTVSLTVMYELWNINCKPERNVWVVKYKLQAWAWCMSCEIWTVSLSVMYELLDINCKPKRNVWVVKYKLQAWACCHALRSDLQFIYHNSYITLRLTVYISQLTHYAPAYSLYFTTQTVSLSVMYELWNINCKPERNVWVVKYIL